MSERIAPGVFDYRALRLLMGILAICLPIAVEQLNGPPPLSSISASYWADGTTRDVFVGTLFAVAAFLFAYRGNSDSEKYLSPIASFCAILVATFPTTADGCDPNLASYVHQISAVALFMILAFIAYSPFRKDLKGKGGKRQFRSGVYLMTSTLILLCILAGLIAGFLDSLSDFKEKHHLLGRGPVALCAFGSAWIISGKFTRLLVDGDEEVLKLIRKHKAEN